MALSVRKLSKTHTTINEIKIGISQGQLRTGYYGGKNRITYTFLGEHTNLAARMMSLAKANQILVSQKIQEVAYKQFDFNLLGSLALKGFIKPIPVYALTRKLPIVKEDIESTAHFTINREKEKDRIILLQEIEKDNQSRGILLESETGLGKTNYALWFQEEAKKANIEIYKAKAEAIEQNVPYHPLLPVLIKIFSIDLLNHSELQLKEKINSRLRAIDTELVKWSPLLNIVLPIQWKETNETEALVGIQRNEKFTWLFKKYLLTYVSRNGYY